MLFSLSENKLSFFFSSIVGTQCNWIFRPVMWNNNMSKWFTYNAINFIIDKNRMLFRLFSTPFRRNICRLWLFNWHRFTLPPFPAPYILFLFSLLVDNENKRTVVIARKNGHFHFGNVKNKKLLMKIQMKSGYEIIKLINSFISYRSVLFQKEHIFGR